MDNQKKIKIIALVGESGSGKDIILKWIVSRMPELHKIIGCTSRPPREGEQEGIDYYFLSKSELLPLTTKELIDKEEFNGWIYGTRIKDLDPDKVNIGVFNFHAIEHLYKDNRLEVYTVYIDADDKTRMMRQLKRENHPDCYEIARRFLSDRKDLDNCDLHINWVIHNEDSFEVAYNAAPLVKFISSLEDDSGNIS